MSLVPAFDASGLGLKRQRAEAERQERERQEAERKRQEEARRQAEAARRWREEQGRVERLERLASVWRRNRRLRRLFDEVKAAVGNVEATSELGRWLEWMSDHVEGSDPLQHLRQRKGKQLTVYYHGYDHDRVSASGFTETESAPYSKEKVPFGIELTERPADKDLYYGYERALKVELPEDLLLPFEWAQESDWLWRVFRVPASLLNRTLGFGNHAETTG